MPESFETRDVDPALADLIVDAFDVHVDVDCASRHLWTIHHEVQQVRAEQAALGADELAGESLANVDNATIIENLLAKARMPEDLSSLDVVSETDQPFTADQYEATFFDVDDPQPQVHGQGEIDDQPDYTASSATRQRGVRARPFGRRALALAGAPALTIVLMLGMSSTGIAMASQSSRPGDLLYSIKRGTEQARLAMATDEASRADLHLTFANERLKELRDVGAVKPEVVVSLVTDISESLGETADITAVERIRQATLNEVKHLEQVAPLPVVVAIPPSLADKNKTIVLAPTPTEKILPPVAANPSMRTSVPPTAPVVEEIPAPAEIIAVNETPVPAPVKPKPTEVVKPTPSDAIRALESVKPTGKPSVKPIAAKPSEKPSDKPTDKPSDKPVDKPTTTPPPVNEQPGGKPTNSVEEPSPKDEETKNREEVGEGSVTAKPIVKPTTKPSSKPVIPTSPKPAKPNVKPIVKPIDEIDVTNSEQVLIEEVDPTLSYEDEE